MEEKIYTGWHFLTAEKKLQFEDGRKVSKGVWMKARNCEKPVLCNSGMHASPSVLEALQYAPGAVLCRVEVRGDVVHGDDKFCGRERRIIEMVDFTRHLHEFACVCAEQALKIAGVYDERCHDAITVKRLWLDGKATNAELDAARDAAWDAARDAAWDAARDAARAAAWDAAWAAAWAAARDAARDAAWAAAWDAAWAAARDAARDAAWAAQKKLLEKIAMDALANDKS